MRLPIMFILFGAALLLALPTLAQETGYIQINHSTIVTNPGQRPQVVVQFGNRGQTALSGVSITCNWNYDLGTPGRVQKGPFRYVRTYNDLDAFGFLYDAADFGFNSMDGMLIDNVTLIPGQNYNVAFEIRIGRNVPRGTEGHVDCALFDSSGFLDFDSKTIRVQ